MDPSFDLGSTGSYLNAWQFIDKQEEVSILSNVLGIIYLN